MSEDKKVKVSELIKVIPNRFLLTLAAAKRARQLQEGAKPLVSLSEENQPAILTALREIQEGKINVVMNAKREENEALLDEIHQYLDTDILDVAEEGSESDDKDKKSASKKDKKLKTKAKSLGA